MSLVPLPESLPPFLRDYLPQKHTATRPFVTLTYAQSLDAKIAAAPGTQTKISHAETKSMTHYLRAHHTAILVGIGTVLADDPKLNCRFGTGPSPVPVVVDPRAQWDYASSQLRRLCDTHEGKAPYIIVDSHAQVVAENNDIVERQQGKYIRLPLVEKRADSWPLILQKLRDLGVDSLMVEGGAKIISELLARPALVDSVIVTVGPVYLGANGVAAAPLAGVNLHSVSWWTGTQDAVVAGRLAP